MVSYCLGFYFRFAALLMFAFLLTPVAYAECLIKQGSNGMLVAEETAIWKNREIPVCWENAADVQIKGMVREVISRNFEHNSALRFTGWGRCGDSDKGLRILVDDQAHPQVNGGFGCQLDGKRNGIILNFKFEGEYKCPYNNKLDGCIFPIAVHEFGHALGFHHEQNRSDTDSSSACYKENYQISVPNELKVTSWDMDSIMNYCNQNWNGGGVKKALLLSSKDIEGLQKIYGQPRKMKDELDALFKITGTANSVSTTQTQWHSGAIHCSGHNKRNPTCDITLSSGHGCQYTTSAPGNQCSFPKDNAVALCLQHPQCFALTCSPDRNTCQARSKAESRISPDHRGAFGAFRHYLVDLSP